MGLNESFFFNQKTNKNRKIKKIFLEIISFVLRFINF